MSFEFVFQYPAWFLVFCLLCGLGFAWLLYRRDAQFREASAWLKRVLFALRFAAIAILAFLLLSPLLRFVTRTVEKPVILLLQDNSASLNNTPKSKAQMSNWEASLEQLETKLEGDYEFKKYSFSEALQDSFSLQLKGKETDIASAFNQLNTLYLNRNVGAVLVASDGIFNKGISPLYARNELNAPVFTIAFGDTAVQRDLLIEQVNHNQLAYLNNTFPVEVVVNARKLAGKKAVLSIELNGKVLERRDINIDNSSFLLKCDFRFKAEAAGIQRYRAVLSTVDGEYTTANNSRDFFIEVLDSRQKILILADAPHPDVAAIRFSLQQNDNYEVETQMASAFRGSLKPYSLVILHQLPSRNNLAVPIFQEIETHNTPVLFVVGQMSQLTELNRHQNVIISNSSRGGFNDVVPRFNKDFSLFTLPDELLASLNTLEPLQIPNAALKLNPQASMLFSQRIGSVDTQYPMIAFSNAVDQKKAVIVGEGIWRWRLQSFAEKQSHSLFDAFLSRIVQYMSVRTERRNLRIVTRNTFNENEPVTFEAEVYNAAYELVNSPDVNLTVINSKGQKYPFTFSRTATAYRLNAGMFAAGDYRYEAVASLGGKQYTAEGRFVVKPVVAELTQSTADHNLLRTWAERSGGQMIMPEALQSLPDLLKKREDLKPVSHSETRLEELVRLRWIFFLLVALLGLEWFLRRRNGAY